MSDEEIVSTEETDETTPADTTGETGGTTGDTTENPPAVSIIDSVLSAFMDLIDALDLFSPITRGALPTSNSIVCGVAPSSPEEVYMDKNQYIPLDVTLNGKDFDLEKLSNGLNLIHESLTMARSYPSGTDWKIVDITTITEPQIIGREDNNAWIMASSLAVKIYTMKGDSD